MVTFGIKPIRDGLWYLELSTEPLDDHGTSNLKNFVEKPNLRDAKQMLATDNYFWNAVYFYFVRRR